MTTATKNGAPRKQLSDQLDRLDGVIDALDEGLQGAVRDAVESAVKQAVESALLQVLTDPDLQRLLRQATPATAQQPEATPAPPSGILGGIRSAGGRCVNGIKACWRAARLAWRLAGDKARALALAAAAGAVAAAYAARERIASAASTAWAYGRSILGAARGWLGLAAPAFGT